MSRGLGELQRDIKDVLDRGYQHLHRAMRFADLRDVFVVKDGGNPRTGDSLPPARERALKRALKGLVDRGDVLIMSGAGGPADPYFYATVEQVVAVKDTAEAKRIWAEISAQAETAMAKMPAALDRLANRTTIS